MDYVLVSVSVTARKVPEQEMPSPMRYGLVVETDFFEKEGGTHPFTMAVAEALAKAGISPDDGCFIIFESEQGLPMLSTPMKQGRQR